MYSMYDGRTASSEKTDIRCRFWVAHGSQEDANVEELILVTLFPYCTDD